MVRHHSNRETMPASNATSRPFATLLATAILLLSAPFLTAFRGKKLPDTVGSVELRAIEKSLMYIPAGALQQGFSDSDTPPALPADLKVVQSQRVKTVTVDSFYLSAIEATYFMWLQFLDEIKDDPAQYNAMLPDTLTWRTRLAYCEPYVEYYFRHPAYRQYPVVGITREQAMAWCDWLTTWYKSWQIDGSCRAGK